MSLSSRDREATCCGGVSIHAPARGATLLGTGIRLGSLVGLNVRDVNLKAGTLRIHTKGGGQDKVFLNPQLVRMLGQFLEEIAPQGNCGPLVPLFRSRPGRRLGARQVQLRFAALCRKAGIDHPASVHSLRHTFATQLYHRTGDLHLVQRALGHRQITTTEVYARVSDDSLRQVMRSRLSACSPPRACR